MTESDSLGHGRDSISPESLGPLTNLIGAPFKLRGRDPVTGIDCVGLWFEVFRRLGIDLSGIDEDYDDSPEATLRLAEVIPKITRRVEPPLEKLDLALTKMRDGLHHLAIYIGSQRWLSAHPIVGVCQVRSYMVEPFLLGYYRVKGVVQ